MRVLCIDDDPSPVRAARQLLRPERRDLVHATDGAKGLAALERDVFDAVCWT
jgi:CheY-like chemotaxis protein